MGSSKGSTTNVERPQSAQELALLETQNQQLAAGIDIAQQQEDRATETHNVWKNNYLPHEVQQVAPDPAAEARYASQLDSQMPMYAEDTSGARGIAQPQPQQRQGGGQGMQGGSKGGQGGGQQMQRPQSGSKGAS